MKLKWIRSEKIGKNRIPSGDSVYTSTDGRFVIHQHAWGSRNTWYTLDVDGAPARRSEYEHDTLRDAKYVANLIVDPNFEED